jgi:OOP family OmpA-OmpF porin
MMKKTLVAATALSLCSMSAFAAPDDNPSGFYLGAGWGRFNLHLRGLDDVDNAVNSVFHDKDDAWKLFGGYRFNPYFSLEAAYIDFGKPRDHFDASGSSGNYRVHLNGFAPYVIGTLPLGPIELFGKAGYYFYDDNITADFDQPLHPHVDSTHSRTDFLYGGGLGVTVLSHLNLRAEYEKVDVSHARDADAFWLSAAWRF